MYPEHRWDYLRCTKRLADKNSPHYLEVIEKIGLFKQIPQASLIIKLGQAGTDTKPDVREAKE